VRGNHGERVLVGVIFPGVRPGRLQANSNACLFSQDSMLPHGAEALRQPLTLGRTAAAAWPRQWIRRLDSGPGDVARMKG
jgi:hypothetical protein